MSSKNATQNVPLMMLARAIQSQMSIPFISRNPRPSCHVVSIIRGVCTEIPTIIIIEGAETKNAGERK